MSQTDLNRLLRQWGLKANESRVMQVCWQQGRGLYVHELVTLSKLKRSTIDLVLVRLIERGLLVRQKIDRRYQYVAESLDRLLEKQTQQIDLLESLKPLFDSWQHGQILPAARVYEGIYGISDVYREMLAVLGPKPLGQRTLLSIESGIDILRLRPDLEKFFIRERIKRHINIRIVCPRASAYLEPYNIDPKKLRDCRYFEAAPKDFAMALYLYDDRVALISLRSPLQAIVLQHPVILGSLRTVYELLWHSLK